MLRTFAVAVTLACLGWAAPSAALAAKPGSRDSSFGTAGRAFAGLNRSQLGHPGGYVNAAAVVRQPGGRLVAAGTLNNRVMFLAAFTSRGRLDPSFGNRGIVIGGTSRAVNSLIRQPDGKLVVGGTLAGRMMLARYTPSGRLDRSFGHRGSLLVQAGPGTDVVQALRPRAGGRILAVGSAGAHSALVQLLSDGRFDGAFGNDGKVVLNVPGPSNDLLTGVVIDSRHRIVASGTRLSTAFILRLTSRGALDTTFGSSGVASVPQAEGNAVALDARGRVLLAGSVQYALGFLVARFTAQGRLDGGFGTAGVLRTSLGHEARAIKVDRAGRALLAGAGSIGATSSCGILARTSSRGALDGTFGLGRFPDKVNACRWGSQAFEFGHGGAGLEDLLLTPDARIVVIGTRAPDENHPVADLYVARYHS